LLLVLCVVRGATFTLPSTDSSTPQSAQSTEAGTYCDCEVDSIGNPKNWDYNGIWLDIVVIVDISEAMGENAIHDAKTLIESFISDGVSDFLVTDTNASFYSRVGVISIAETAVTIYTLNMTKDDTLEGKLSMKKGVVEIDVLAAFEAALNMLNDGLENESERASTRQVIYYITHSDAKNNMNPINQFKASQGVIMVNNTLQKGDVEFPGLKELASAGYYFSNDSTADNNPHVNFCKANCYCTPDKNAYRGVDPAIRAAGGCYHAAPAGVPFNKAKVTCSNGGGGLATIHDEQKGIFLQQLMDNADDSFWIGYEKTDDEWQWIDESADPYTNWGENEPVEDSMAKCAYVDTSNTTLSWVAGNCQIGLPYVCQYTPCSVGNKDC
ncbi:hypothetical protein PMAYCL1PPCAC_28337, partial [Pristionchus mayeri]